MTGCRYNRSLTFNQLQLRLDINEIYFFYESDIQRVIDEIHFNQSANYFQNFTGQDILKIFFKMASN